MRVGVQLTGALWRVPAGPVTARLGRFAPLALRSAGAQTPQPDHVFS